MHIKNEIYHRGGIKDQWGIPITHMRAKTKPSALYLMSSAKIDARWIKDTRVKTHLEKKPGEYLK